MKTIAGCMTQRQIIRLAYNAIWVMALMIWVNALIVGINV